MEVKWGTCGDNGAWCGLLTVNLESPIFDKEGVYVIWQRGGPIIKIGKGRFRDKIGEDKMNSNIVRYGSLLVTWAYIEGRYRSGIENYLKTQLHPSIDSEITETPPIKINLPWPSY